MKRPHGKLRTKTTVYCEICGCNCRRVSSVNIYSSDQREIDNAKKTLTKKAHAKYTCRICKTIIKDLK